MIFDKETFKNSVIQKRKEDKQSMDVACKLIGISKATLSRIENGGMPDTNTFILITNWLNIDFSKFILVK